LTKKKENNVERTQEITAQPHIYRDAHLTVDFERQTATLDAAPMILTRKEFELLALLVGYAGEIVPREEQLMRVWGYSTEIRTRTLDVHIRHLRKKLGAYADRYIETIFGIGHRFQPCDSSRRVAPRVDHSLVGQPILAAAAFQAALPRVTPAA
jgi:DNA-binding response OmpR family regulator